MNDGWHKIAGYDVYVENNCIVRGVTYTRNAYGYVNTLPAYPYRISRNGGLDNCSGISVNAFKSGVYRKTICMM